MQLMYHNSGELQNPKSVFQMELSTQCCNLAQLNQGNKFRVPKRKTQWKGKLPDSKAYCFKIKRCTGFATYFPEVTVYI